MDPVVSVLIITHNRAEYLKHAIESVANQSYKNIELIIVDNNSMDNTADVVVHYSNKDKRIKYFFNKINKISYSRNLAFSFSIGKYIAILDSDDFWIDRDKLKKQVDFLETNNDYVLVGGSGRVIKRDGGFLRDLIVCSKFNDIRRKMLLNNNFIHSAVMYRRDSFVLVGGYDEGLLVSEDYDLFLKLNLIGRSFNFEEKFISYMFSEFSISNQKKTLLIRTQLSLILKYKNKYPNFLFSYVYIFIKLIFYGYLGFKNKKLWKTKEE